MVRPVVFRVSAAEMMIGSCPETAVCYFAFLTRTIILDTE